MPARVQLSPCVRLSPRANPLVDHRLGCWLAHGPTLSPPLQATTSSRLPELPTSPPSNTFLASAASPYTPNRCRASLSLLVTHSLHSPSNYDSCTTIVIVRSACGTYLFDHQPSHDVPPKGYLAQPVLSSERRIICCALVQASSHRSSSSSTVPTARIMAKTRPVPKQTKSARAKGSTARLQMKKNKTIAKKASVRTRVELEKQRRRDILWAEVQRQWEARGIVASSPSSSMEASRSGRRERSSRARLRSSDPPADRCAARARRHSLPPRPTRGNMSTFRCGSCALVRLAEDVNLLDLSGQQCLYCRLSTPAVQ